MPDTWISDMQHFVGIDDPELDVPARARKMGEYLGRIVSAATSCNVEQPLESVISCRRRPRNRSCPGHIRLVRRQDGNIIWQCSSCGDNGMIYNWQGTVWDLSGPEQVFDYAASLPAEVLGAAADISGLPRTALRVIMRTSTEKVGLLLTGTRAEMDSLKSAVARAAGRSRGNRKKLLHQLLSRLEGGAVGEDGEPGSDPPGSRAKISETLLFFAKPLFDIMGLDPPVEVAESALMAAVTVWNAEVIKQWRDGEDYTDQARQLIAKGLPQFLPMFETLVRRKKQYFADDLRAISDFKVYCNADGELRVSAEARIPKDMPIH